MADPVTAGLMIGGTVLSAGGALSEGKSAMQSDEFSAAQKERNALAAEAQSHREAAEERRKIDLLQSRARAVAAAGGGTTTDVGVTEILSQLEREGEHNALSALFEGRQQAEGLRLSAAGDIYQGKVAKKASKLKALTTVMSGGQKMQSAGMFG